MYDYRVIRDTHTGYLEDRINSLVDEGYEFVSLAASDSSMIIVMRRKRVVH
jgi:hypothetical protein